MAVFSKVRAVEDYPHAQFDRKLSTMHTANKLYAAFLQTVSIGLMLIPCTNDFGGQGTVISVCMGAVKKKKRSKLLESDSAGHRLFFCSLVSQG